MGGEGFPCCPFWGSGQLTVRRMGMGKTGKQYDRLRLNTGQHRRIYLMMLLFGVLAFLPVFWRLYDLMVRNYDRYAALACADYSA